jgi:hypothetical protein
MYDAIAHSLVILFGKDLGEFGNNDDVTFFSAAPAEGAGEADSLLSE